MRKIFYNSTTNHIIEDFSGLKTIEEIGENYQELTIDETIEHYTITDGNLVKTSLAELNQENIKNQEEENLIQDEIRNIAITNLKKQRKL